jgi:transcriptional regulator with XRE-family HTH domain
MVHREVAVVVINRLLILGFTLMASIAHAAVLPDERIDILYHGYDGGGAQIDGPSILVRKSIGSSVSVAANYYVDMVTSASIDVEATASPYSEERKEQGLSAQYMVDRSTISVGYVSSKENDYDATTYSLGIDQSFFGDLTTLGFGVSFGEDIVGQNTDPTYKRDLQRRKYSINASQIITKNLLASLSFDSASDQCLNLADTESCLNNPYRSVRFLTGTGGYAYQGEIYPHTRNSDAVGLRLMYFLPYRASLRAELRQFSDSWGIESENAELRYLHPYGERFLFEVKYRIYDQTGADFYADLFPFRDAQNFMARDKELSPFSSTVLGLGVTYKVPAGTIPWFEKSTVNLYWDHFNIDYDDFRDARVSPTEFAAGSEPLYSLDADVIRFYLSFWF